MQGANLLSHRSVAIHHTLFLAVYGGTCPSVTADVPLVRISI